MIRLDGNSLAAFRGAGVAGTVQSVAGCELFALARSPKWASPYSAAATAILKQDFSAQWPAIMSYGQQHPEIVPYVNAYVPEDEKIIYSIVPTLGVNRWLKGDGTAYIEVNYYPNCNSHVKTYLAMRYGADFAPYGIIGGWKYGWNGNIFSNYNNDVKITQTISSGGYMNKEMYVEQNKNLAYLDGELVKEHTYSQWTETRKLVLFRNHAHRPKFDIANFVIKEGGDTLQWLVPFIRNGENGMLEMISNTFYSNIAGSGSFTISEEPAA